MMYILTDKDIMIATREIYDGYMNAHNKKNGMCFGASLHFAVEILKQAGKGDTPTGMTLNEVHRLRIQDVFLKYTFQLDASTKRVESTQRLLMQNELIEGARFLTGRDFPLARVREFYDFSMFIQNYYETSEGTEEGLIAQKKQIVSSLNAQAQLLANSIKCNAIRENKLKYTLLNGNETGKKLNGLLKNRKGNENTAMIINTRLVTAKSRAQLFSHSTVVINYEQSLYFYDINKGVYILPKPWNPPFCNENLFLTLASNLQVKGVYRLTPLPHHIFIEIEKEQ
ncbi:hypothetical protein [Enterobacter sp. Bisph1]|uniref:hypothetical protein n=1 Tax=Enterobacter sp. Bisph1 TaxID=1274399 RepID=UPI0012E09794|nr:hypothetical protein [Enterobacter sp. Bisph1]